ncbi:hypothetical protein [Demequina subtropica]|uniref:hypothetical protein n=1 Tax=Demequina subtropica TaxID=1638989 RepID=UPI0007829FAD|nr:hypothetical protein [Demequina subtropica]
MTTMRPQADEASSPELWAGSGIALVIALTVIVGAYAIHGPGEASAAAGSGVGAGPVQTLDAALDANVAELEYFMELGGSLDDRTAGLMVLDAVGDAAVGELEDLARGIVRSLGADPAVVSEAIAEAESEGVSADGVTTGVARDGELLVICSEAHGGMSIGLEARAA